MQHPDRGVGSFIVVDLGVCDAGVVVDDGVDEGVADQRVPVLALAPVQVRCRAVLPALGPADEPPAAADRDVAELLHVDVDQ